MKWSSKLFTVLVALIVLTFLPSVIVSNPSPGDVLTTLAIDVGSSAARLSALIGVNGFAFGDTGKPRIILTGPGTHSSPGPLKSNWTSEGFLLIKDGTDEAHYVHAFNTLFNLDHPIEMRSRDKYSYHNRPNITGYQAFSLIDITGKYMEKLKTSAESIVGHTIDFVAIVLPNGRNLRTATKNIINDRRWGNFTSYVRVYVDGNDPQKTKGVMNSATMPLQVSNTVELYERASAAIFSFDNGMEYRRPFLVYRLGSSTFEVSIHDVEGGKFNTISSVYDQRLGGNNFNQRVVDRLLLAHKNKTGQDLSGDDMFLLRLRSEVENAKQSLSVRDRVLIEIEPLQTGGEGLSEVLTRSQFEEFNMDLFNKTITAIDRAIKDSTMYTKDDIQDVVFSGGSANIPFSSRPLKMLGAAKLGHWYQDERHFTGGVCCVGASIATIGIETAGGAMFKFTDRNSYRTVNKMYTLTTTKDYQDQVVIRVYRGKGKWTSQNRFLGETRLTGIAPAPKGTPQIRVWLVSYGCGGFINLNVMDVASGRVNATILDIYDHGKRLDNEIGVFELEPAGKLTLLQ